MARHGRRDIRAEKKLKEKRGADRKAVADEQRPSGVKVAVLEGGMKYTPISISPEQAQFLETRKFQVNEIARIFRVPPHMVGDLEKSSFSNIEQ